jgi:vacuolar-type H+-ATPase subunit H
MRSQPAERAPAGNGLSILLEAERRLSARLEAVTREADAIVAEAEAQARRRLDELDLELQAEGEALARSIEAGAANRIEELRSQADATVTRYRSVAEDTVVELARHAVGIVVRAGDEELA